MAVLHMGATTLREPAETIETLWRVHHEAVYGYLRRFLGEEAAAEEALQDTFVAAWRAAASYEGRSSERTWLIGIARHKALGHLRARDRRRVQAAGADRKVAPSAEQEALAILGAAELLALVDQLRPHHREVVAAVFAGGLSMSETAEALNIPVGTVKSRLWAARSALAHLAEGAR